MKKKVEEEKMSFDETMMRFSRISKILAICCIILLLIGCFINDYAVFENCNKVTFDLAISVFVSLIIVFMGSFGLGYYFSFKTLGSKKQEKNNK